MLSCGAALHHCTVALAAAGWHAKVQRLPDPQSPEHLATIEVTPKPADELDIVLCLAIGLQAEPTGSQLPVVAGALG